MGDKRSHGSNRLSFKILDERRTASGGVDFLDHQWLAAMIDDVERMFDGLPCKSGTEIEHRLIAADRTEVFPLSSGLPEILDKYRDEQQTCQPDQTVGPGFSGVPGSRSRPVWPIIFENRPQGITHLPPRLEKNQRVFLGQARLVRTGLPEQ